MAKKGEEIVKREIGERVDILCSLEPTSVKSLGDGVFEAIITTSEVDRTRESIDTTGIETKNWIEKNPVVLYGHDYFGLPIGKGLSLQPFKNKMKSRFQLAIEEYPFAATVAKMIAGGYLNAVSIGGKVLEWSDDFKTILKMEMLEFSVVPIPANPSAIITQRSFEKAAGKEMEQVQKEYKDFARSVLIDKATNLGEDGIIRTIEVLDNLLAAHKESAQAASSAREDKPKVRLIKRVALRNDANAVFKQAERLIKTIKLKR